MAEKNAVKTEALPDLDDLLQCPVCYEIPTGQIFQCNEGHHVCGRCKMRLDVCPVCRAFFFGTRNYAMEELISNVRKLRAFKLGGKVTTGTTSTDGATTARDEPPTEAETNAEEEEEGTHNFASRPTFRAPQACKGLFRCLCCKSGQAERLPAARLLNHLRYYHSPELIEGLSENGEYLQAWQFPTTPGKIVTAVRIADMGIFFLTIEIKSNFLCAWLTMAASPWVAHEFAYTVTISGNDREAIFSDSVWSVRSCEGSLKKRGHCLLVNGLDAQALTAPAAINGKLSVRRMPADQLATAVQPRAVLRVANRGANRDANRDAVLPGPQDLDLEPFLQGLQNDVRRLSRAFATLGREADALRARADDNRSAATEQNANNLTSPPAAPSAAETTNTAAAPMSRNARRRMRQRLRAALNATESPNNNSGASAQPSTVQAASTAPMTNGNSSRPTTEFIGYAVLVPSESAPSQPSASGSSGPSNGNTRNGNQSQGSKKKRRQRR